MENLIQNAHLNGNEFQLVQNNNICVILIHGFTATPVEVRPIALELFNAGFDVFAPLLPGHNTNPDNLNNVKYSDWIEEVDKKYNLIKNDYEWIFVGGESMGGLLACYLAEKNPEIAGLILYAPALIVKNISAVKFIKYFKPYFGHPAEDPPGVDRIDGTYIFPWKGYKIKPTFALHELNKLQKIIKRNLNKITQPTLIFQGNLDQTVDINGAGIIYQKIDSSEKELIHLKNSSHCIILDQEFDLVSKKTIEFIRNISTT